MSNPAAATNPIMRSTDKKDFSAAILTFVRDGMSRNRNQYRDRFTDNFRGIGPKDFRVLA